MDYNFRMFENEIELSFEYFSGSEIASIVDRLLLLLDINNNQIQIVGEEEEKIILKNVEYKKINNYVNKKTQVTLIQYGINPWGKVEFLFEEV
jgi:hypothetical protein